MLRSFFGLFYAIHWFVAFTSAGAILVYCDPRLAIALSGLAVIHTLTSRVIYARCREDAARAACADVQDALRTLRANAARTRSIATISED